MAAVEAARNSLRFIPRSLSQGTAGRALGARAGEKKANVVLFQNKFRKSFEIMLAIRLIDLVKDFCTVFAISKRLEEMDGPVRRGDCLEEFILQARFCTPRRCRSGFGLSIFICEHS